jgi:hemerythrin
MHHRLESAEGNDPMEERPQFDASYLVGIEQIDQEHQRLFAIAGRAYDELNSPTPSRDATAAAIDALLEYTSTHFANEEMLMEIAGYPGLENHRQLHRGLLAKARDMEIRAVAGENCLPLELSRFLCHWLIDHIRNEDRKFGEFAGSLTP